MSIRKLIMVSIIALAAVVPLVGCGGGAGDTGGTEAGTGADAGGSETSNTTTP